MSELVRQDSKVSMREWSVTGVFEQELCESLFQEEDRGAGFAAPPAKARAAAKQPKAAPRKQQQPVAAAHEAASAELQSCVTELNAVLQSGRLDEDRSKCLRWVLRCLSYTEAELEAMAEHEREFARSVRQGARSKRQEAQQMARDSSRASEGAVSAAVGTKRPSQSSERKSSRRRVAAPS